MSSDRPERPSEYAAWLRRVSAKPWSFDFYQAMRRIASAHPRLPPLGEALRPQDEPVRVAQPAELDFAPAPLHGLRLDREPAPLLLQRIFGLLGPNGALPLHLTEYARERARHHADPTFQRFLDTLTHRFALLFYRAWAEAQPTVSLDRAGNKAYFNRLGSLIGIGLPTLQDRDALSDASKIYFAGRLATQTRDAEGLLSWIRTEFDVPAAVEPWCGHWMPLMRSERSRLGRRDGALLGRSMVLGGSVWDVQHKFRITMGPLALDRYRRFLPGMPDLERLKALVRHWVGIELAWDAKLILARSDVPRFELGATRVPDTDESPLVSEGTHEAELVSVRNKDTAFGARVCLVFRIADGEHRGAELTESAPLNVSLLSRIGGLLRALAASAIPAKLSEDEARTPAARSAVGAAAAPEGANAGGAGVPAEAQGTLGPVRSGAAPSGGAAGETGIGLAASEGTAIHETAVGKPFVDETGRNGAARAGTALGDAVGLGVTDGGTPVGVASVDGLAAGRSMPGKAPAVSLATAHLLIGRRCHIAVRHERSADGRIQAAIGVRTGLGHTTWLGRYLRLRDADDLRLDIERPCAEA